MELHKFERQLRLMMMLTQNRNYTLEELGERLGMSSRNVYRYIEAFKMSGFVVRKKDKCYYLDKSSPYFKDVSSLVHFTEEEAYVLKRAIENIDGNTAMKQDLKQKLFALFGLEDFMDKHIVLLSSGELRKFQLTKALISRPSVLILDNPFIGLDAPTRDLLRDLLEKMIQVMHLHVILVLSREEEIPSFVTHVVPVEALVCGEKKAHNKNAYSERSEESECIKEPRKGHAEGKEEIVRLNKVSIRYGERTILNELDWTVCKGEKWALTGENGSGKSTLLSLICADNPQSYACDISLFGRKRGTGESIWEIKKHIGYVSPEIHRAYLKNIPAIDIVASGLHDSVGLYVRPKPEQRAVCEQWMKIFDVGELADTSFLQLSSGEQRLVLLARAFVKEPDLLILDEPLHGLDTSNRKLVKEIIDTYARKEGKTLIMVSHYQEEFPACITHSLHLKRN